MDRATDYESVGRRFEPCRAHSSKLISKGSAIKKKIKAILISGPPGAGKSPLGEFLEKQSFSGLSFIHFDFGRQLRTILKDSGDSFTPPLDGYFTKDELRRIRQSVEKANLFEENDRELVRKIFRYFFLKKKVKAGAVLVLNGLPRHMAQLDWLEDLVEVVLVVELDCSEETAIKRILNNLKKERKGREDDQPEVISRRYKLYKVRTEPLLNYFRQIGIPVIRLKVDLDSDPRSLWAQLKLHPEFQPISLLASR